MAPARLLRSLLLLFWSFVCILSFFSFPYCLLCCSSALSSCWLACCPAFWRSQFAGRCSCLAFRSLLFLKSGSKRHNFVFCARPLAYNAFFVLSLHSHHARARAAIMFFCCFLLLPPPPNAERWLIGRTESNTETAKETHVQHAQHTPRDPERGRARQPHERDTGPAVSAERDAQLARPHSEA